MLNVSTEWQRSVMLDDNRQYLAYADIVLSDGTKLAIDNSKLWQDGFSIEDATSEESTFTVGALVASKLTIKLNNIYDDYSTYDFTDAKVTAYIGKQLDSGLEKLKIGELAVNETDYNGSIITLECLDNVNKFNKAYDSALSYPTTIYEIVRNACLDCGVPFTMAKFDNSDYVVETKPDNKNTYGQVISYALQICGSWGKCDHEGALTIGWYDLSLFDEKNYTGGTFSTKTTPYSDGDTLNGGNFKDYSSGDTASGGTFTEARKYHNLYGVKEFTVTTDDVVITGIKVSVTSDEDESKDVEYLAGNTGYVIAISDNPLISTDKAKTVADYVYKKIGGMRFRPLSGSFLSDPTIEAGDVAFVTDRKQNVYNAFISNRTFSIGNSTSISCDAESAARNSADSFSADTKTIIEARRTAQKQISTYDTQVQLLTQLMSQSFGLFKTEQVQEDGSIIYIMHNKSDLKSSQIQWKMTTNGMAVSSDYGETWNAGVDASGNAVFNVMSAIGINFDWAHGGTLTLGGENNVSGKQYVKDSKGNILVTLDNKGITLASGVTISWENISGTPTIPTSTSQLENDSNYTTMTDVEGKGYQNSQQVENAVSSGTKDIKSDISELKKNIGYTQIGSDYVISPKIVGAYGQFTRAFNVDVVDSESGLNQSFWAQTAEVGTKISGSYDGHAIDQNLTVNPNGANLFSSDAGGTSSVGVGGGEANMNASSNVSIGTDTFSLDANKFLFNGSESLIASKTYSDGLVWKWRQWSDGFLELWGNATATVSTGSGYGNLYYVQGYQDLPQGIKSISNATATVFAGTGLYFINFNSWTTSTLNFLIASARSESNRQLHIQFYVTGTWK